MNITSWNHETSQAYVGTLLYSLLGVISAILTPIATASTLASIVGASSGGGFTAVLLVIVKIAIICGYIIFFLAIKDLKAITEGEDKVAFGKIYTSIIINVLGMIISFIPLLGWLSGLCSIASCILLLLAYSALRNSRAIEAISPVAIAGFRQLFTAQVLAIIGVCLAWIPIINIASAVLMVIAWILVLVGWKKVATPVAVEGEEPAAAKPIFETVKEVVTESYAEAKEVAKDAAGIAADAAETAKEAAKDVADKAKEVASEVADKAKEAADKAKDAAKDVAEKAKDVAADVKEKFD